MLYLKEIKKKFNEQIDRYPVFFLAYFYYTKN